MNIRILFIMVWVILSICLCNAATKPYNYSSAWSAVEQLQRKGLPKSMDDKVHEIYDAAVQDGNSQQQIKALIYRLIYMQQVEDNSDQKAIQTVETELAKASLPSSAILHSMLAEMYWSYYQSNRWQFQDRTETVNFKQDDISTWDLKTITRKAIEEYKLSLLHPEELAKVQIKDLQLLVRNGDKYQETVRPTLYDFLAHRALAFYMNSESGLTKPIDEFKISDMQYFKSADQFCEMKITTQDSLSLNYLSVTLFQDLIRFHLKDPTPYALAAVDIERLEYVYEHTNLTNREELLNTAYRNQMSMYQDSPVYTVYAFALAFFTKKMGDEYNPSVSEKYRWYYKDAHDLCQTILDDPKSQYCLGSKENLSTLKNQLEYPSVEAQIENTVPIDKPIKASCSIKRMTSLQVRIYRLNFDEIIDRESIYYSSRKQSNLIVYNRKYLLEKTYTFQDEGDYRSHTFEIAIPGLKCGRYLLLVSDDFSKPYKDQFLNYSDFAVTDLSFVHQNMDKSTLLVLSRQTGLPKNKVKVHYYKGTWNEKKSQNTKSLDWTRSTDETGRVVIPKPGYDSWNDHYILEQNGDTLLIQNLYIYGDSKSVERSRCILFTDRGIYRPWQTIYFKGLLYTTDFGKKNTVDANKSIAVSFYDVNYKLVSTLNLKTNEFGTFSGEFIAPKNTLTGNMTIRTDWGSTSFSVEEYKRPAFEVTIDQPKDTFQLGQTVTVQGKVMSYAGFPIDNATVSYRITRQPRWHFWYWWWGSHSSTPEKEVSQGIVKTNDLGEFRLSFLADADQSVSSFGNPYFNFQITADATDQNGETHSGQLSLGIGNTSLILNPAVPETINLDSKKYTININTTNFSGEKVAAQGTLTITRLKTPARVLKSRIWQKPDKTYYKLDEYLKHFPNDIYKDENIMSTWAMESQVFSGDFDTSQKNILDITDLDKWKPGAYVLEAVTHDVNHKQVTAKRYFTLYTAKGSNLPYPLADWFVPMKIAGEPGETASFIIGSGYDKVSVLYEVEKDSKLVESKRISLSNEQKILTIPILESDRGGFSVHFTFVKDNRVYTHDQLVTVPWTNKMLDFEYMTFRNKLLPGQDEEWRLKIKDHTGGKVTAEVLAAMYDASLDAFRAVDWPLDIYHTLPQRGAWSHDQFIYSRTLLNVNDRWYPTYPSVSSMSFNWFGYNLMSYGRYTMDGMALSAGVAPSVLAKGEERELRMEKTASGRSSNKKDSMTIQTMDVAEQGAGGIGAGEEDLSGIQARSNFAETAFFYPRLRTDEDGEVMITFTAPESLTRWKFRALALTADLKYGITDSTMVTQKPLMVIPNAPRFFREGDRITFSSKITSMDEKDQSGVCQLMLFDAITMKPVESVFKLKNAQKNFQVKKGESTTLEWEITIPFGVDAVTYRVVAKAGDFSDGEEKTIPILTNRMLVTESMPLPVRGHSKRTFVFDKLKNSATSTTLKNFKLTLEYTSNPAWYAIQALPYMMEYPYECSEQTFARYYANSIASFIANSNPRIKKVFDSWKDTPGSQALLSNLEKNEELKSVLLQETPWVMDARHENERKHRIGLLFDLNKMTDEYERSLNKLQQSQMQSGAWSWFKGMPESWWVTQYIVEGFGHLDHLGIQYVRGDTRTWGMVQRAVAYMDRKIVEDYDRILKYGNEKRDNLGYMEIHYLYARSYFLDITMDKQVKKAVDYFKGQAETYWLSKGKYGEGMLALSMKRLGNVKLPVQIIASLKERSQNSQELGMYWKDNVAGWFWYEAPIETQALLIEAFREVTPKDTSSVDDMRTWLLKRKQTTDWKTTKATAEACYALLLSGTEWLSNDKLCEIKVDDKVIDPMKLDGTRVEAGTGYFKTSWSGGDIKPSMSVVSVTNPNDVSAWGAMYWQYFENLDKITPAETPLKLNKKLFLERKTKSGLVLDPISLKTELHVGDKVIVRIELRSDRDMEYVHMKDMRSSGFEPINVLSQYKWQDGLGYYEATGDAATNFFIEYLRKGTYVFEYPLWVTHKGDFSNGVTTIQCMYAPEFTSHSEGIRVEVK